MTKVTKPLNELDAIRYADLLEHTNNKSIHKFDETELILDYIPSVMDIKAYIFNEYVTGDALTIQVPKDQLLLRFTNMFNYGNTSLICSDGITRTVLNNVFKNIKKYLVFICILNQGQTTSQYSYPTLDDNKGTWGLFQSIDDLNIQNSDKLWYDVLLTGLPSGKICFWMGVSTQYNTSELLKNIKIINPGMRFIE
jgi:hypothetical protein